jgi:DNA mismatch endonuclease (patch repair protein)
MPVRPSKPLTRSENMSRIKGRDTGPEMLLRRRLFAAGLRFRVDHRCGIARPDIVFISARVAIFVDGCFWHGCPIHAVMPKSNTAFWSAKLTKNVARDGRQTSALEMALGSLGARVPACFSRAGGAPSERSAAPSLRKNHAPRLRRHSTPRIRRRGQDPGLPKKLARPSLVPVRKWSRTSIDWDSQRVSER